MEVRKDKPQLNNSGMLVGFDLGRYAVQISYYRPGMEGPETAEQVTGSEVFNIPMVLCKRNGVNQWFYGREAIRYNRQEGGILVDHLLQKAVDGETVEVEGSRIEGILLLTLFIRRAMSVLGSAHKKGAITDVMFTCENLGNRVVEIMGQVAENLQLKNCNVYFQSYAESIYHYMIHQPAELWKNSVLASHYDGHRVKNYRFRRNLHTTPVVTFVDEDHEEEMPFPQIITEDARASAYRRLDERYADHMKDVLRDDVYSSVYLLGDGFKDNWMDQTVGLLCHNRRLFVGNDIFSRGACFALADRYDPTDEARSHVYLGADKLKSNIGLNVLRRGEDSYLALMDAGINWYDISCEYELFLPEDGKLSLVIIPLDGSGHFEHELELGNLPDRDPDTLRVRLTMNMASVDRVKIHIEDLGFGEMYPASGMEWDFELEV